MITVNAGQQHKPPRPLALGLEVQRSPGWARQGSRDVFAVVPWGFARVAGGSRWSAGEGRQSLCAL